MLSLPGDLPPGYRAVTRGRLGAFAWTDAVPWLESVLGSDATLHGWAGGQADTGRLSGRGPVHVVVAPVPGPDARAHWAVRHYARGGLAAPLLGDRYLAAGPPRPLLELRASALARSRGVRTPAVVAGAVYHAWGSSRAARRVGRGLYRADLVTELVPAVRSLEHALFGADAASRSTSGSTPAGALRRAGSLVRALASAGVLHADLSAGNILVGSDIEDAWVVDLDRCVVAEGPEHGREDARAGADAGAGEGSPARTMLGRLERSLRKLGSAHGRPLSEAEWAALHGGHAEGA